MPLVWEHCCSPEVGRNCHRFSVANEFGHGRYSRTYAHEIYFGRFWPNLYLFAAENERFSVRFLAKISGKTPVKHLIFSGKTLGNQRQIGLIRCECGPIRINLLWWGDYRRRCDVGDYRKGHQAPGGGDCRHQVGEIAAKGYTLSRKGALAKGQRASR